MLETILRVFSLWGLATMGCWVILIPQFYIAWRTPGIRFGTLRRFHKNWLKIEMDAEPYLARTRARIKTRGSYAPTVVFAIALVLIFAPISFAFLAVIYLMDYIRRIRRAR